MGLWGTRGRSGRILGIPGAKGWLPARTVAGNCPDKSVFERMFEVWAGPPTRPDLRGCAGTLLRDDLDGHPGVHVGVEMDDRLVGPHASDRLEVEALPVDIDA